jgi:predicted kinase
LDPELLARISVASRPIVLIDGRSGSGKSTFASQLAPALGAQLVRLDDIYPGWSGLLAASDHVHQRVLAPEPGWQAWDWGADRPGEWHRLDPLLPIVIEGAGSLSAANRALATFGIWMELADDIRKQRALARDGETYAPHWDAWAAQEDAFAAREHPRSLADFEVVG